MKILGISFGRKNERCDILVKEALFAAKEAGAECLKFTFLDKLKYLNDFIFFLIFLVEKNFPHVLHKCIF